MFKNVLLPVDLNDETSWRKALPTAVSICKGSNAVLHLVTVVPDISAHLPVAQYFPDDFEDKLLAQLRTDLHAFSKEHVPEGVKVRHVLAHGSIYKEIIDAAKQVNADLIVMAAHRPEFEDYLLGPNAARVVRHAGCSVMVVRE